MTKHQLMMGRDFLDIRTGFTDILNLILRRHALTAPQQGVAAQCDNDFHMSHPLFSLEFRWEIRAGSFD